MYIVQRPESRRLYDRVPRSSNGYKELIVKYVSSASGRGTCCPLVSSHLMERGLGGYGFHHSDLGVEWATGVRRSATGRPFRRTSHREGSALSDNSPRS